LFPLLQIGQAGVARQQQTEAGEKVNSQKNAKLTGKGREEMIRRMRYEPAAKAAAGFGVSLRTAGKWQAGSKREAPKRWLIRYPAPSAAATG